MRVCGVDVCVLICVCTLPSQPPHTTTIVITGDTRSETVVTVNPTTNCRSKNQKLTRTQAMDRVRLRIQRFAKTYCTSEKNHWNWLKELTN